MVPASNLMPTPVSGVKLSGNLIIRLLILKYSRCIKPLIMLSRQETILYIESSQQKIQICNSLNSLKNSQNISDASPAGCESDCLIKLQKIVDVEAKYKFQESGGGLDKIKTQIINSLQISIKQKIQIKKIMGLEICNMCVSSFLIDLIIFF